MATIRTDIIRESDIQYQHHQQEKQLFQRIERYRRRRIVRRILVTLLVTLTSALAGLVLYTQ